MQRVEKTIKINNISEFESKLLAWAQNFDIICWLNGNNYPQKHSNYDAVLAVGAQTKLSTNYKNAFQQLKTYQSNCNDYIFGYLGYDLKNDTENLTSNNFDGLHFPDLFFFQPKKIFFIKNNTLKISYLKDYKEEIKSDLNAIKSFKDKKSKSENEIKIKLRIHEDAYFQKLNSILNHIHRGDVYEVNFCQEFYAENAVINPLKVFQNLNEISKPPFAAFFKFKNNYLLSASPERYIKKEGNLVISQPIKGTAKRAKIANKDKILIQELAQNSKERAENIMIVDLVRNDLSTVALKGTVKVDELCKVYTFKQVHQLISTISCTVENVHPVTILKKTFPMGSMTGAPKIATMKIIEKLEETKRGLYSGAVGYITPNNDFDFNVIIRSILYNSENQYVSYSVGGAITAKSIPENEYEECLLKAKAMKQVLLNNK
ncbi:anthranilate synthase component I family protein [Lutibacter sp.]|uniref:anthranilate synthase component I family protein n=1 Tax=Lutibacter sp. TaxID=1925666 RepID=UPI0025C43D92|nr:anthranilate synthase component I family protein [Lutibacter sp.]MCF6181378.1 anthranilate synthase component I family protein [Lutibacter sp.]